MRIRSRKTAWALFAFALLFVLASAFLPSFLCCHVCTGDHCPICIQIEVWHAVQRLLGAGLLCMLLCLAGRPAVRALLSAAADGSMHQTPVALKTKLTI